jgi:hypothetical protein
MLMGKGNPEAIKGSPAERPGVQDPVEPKVRWKKRFLSV